MSRCGCLHENGNTVAFGLDHAVGWFYQEFDRNTMECVKDEDSMFSGLSRATLAHRLEQYTDCPKEMINLIWMDLDPANSGKGAVL